MRQLSGEQRHLQRRDAAEVVDENGKAALARLFAQRSDQRVDDGFTVMGVEGGRARFAVDAESQLGLARRNAAFVVAARQVAGLHRHAEAVQVVAGLLRDVAHFAQAFALLGGVARDFMHQRRSGNAARLLVVRQRDIVGDDHHLDLQAVAFGFLGGEAKVETVAGVVFDDQQTAAIAGDGDDGVQYRINARRGEEVAADGGGQHPFADKPGVGRFVAGAAAGDHRHAAFIPVGTGDDADRRVDVEANEVGVRGGEDNPFDGVVDQLFAVIKKESGHNFPEISGTQGKHSSRSGINREKQKIPSPAGG